MLVTGLQVDLGILYYVWTEPTTTGFEPARAEPNGLAVHRLNLSAM
jgi:hypothetical protein